MKHQIRIRADGYLEWLSPPPMPLKLEKQTRVRYSEITPLNPWLCIAFRTLRFLFGEKGRVSDWTRSWKVVWLAHILMGEHKDEAQVSQYRDALITWEHSKFFQPRIDI